MAEFLFRQSTITQAMIRQDLRCAVCGEDVTAQEEHAHHVIPKQSGERGDASDAVLSSDDNCVVLCTGCHGIVHAGSRYRSGAVPPPSYYAFSHGMKTAQHRLWVARFTPVWTRKFARLQAKQSRR